MKWKWSQGGHTNCMPTPEGVICEQTSSPEFRRDEFGGGGGMGGLSIPLTPRTLTIPAQIFDIGSLPLGLNITDNVQIDTTPDPVVDGNTTNPVRGVNLGDGFSLGLLNFPSPNLNSGDEVSGTRFVGGTFEFIPGK